MSPKLTHQAAQTFALAITLFAIPAACSPSANQSDGGRSPTASEGVYTEEMTQVPMPKKGCFKAAFPKTEWQEVPCVTPPDQPYPPSEGHHDPQTVGNGTDFAAEVAGTMSSATGSFPVVTGVTSESGNVGGNPPAIANTYSLQLNTKPFASSVCTGHPTCQGWQQFIFSNSGSAFIQYWLLKFNATCPSGWNTYTFPPPSTDTYCWRNGPNAVAVASQAITNLASLSLSGTANTGGTDSVIMTTAGGNLSAANQDSILNLAAAWQGVEFVLVGDCCLSEAIFNANATLGVRTTVHSGTTTAPTCVMEGFTGETNNLTLVGAPSLPTLAAPAIQTSQSNIAGTAGSCSAAAGVGDTHLRTFLNLFYDFQATGDFLLADADQFVVQARQVSGAPTWPDASVNSGVATQMGSTRVAVCLPDTVAVDGKGVQVADGQMLAASPNVDVIRTGNVYLVIDQNGNSVRAVVNSTWIDVSVGLGRWPTEVHGLLANAKDDVRALETRDGAALGVPVPFEQLYHAYADSWRVDVADSMLSDCGKETERGVPAKPFFAKDLDASVRDRAQNTCSQAGVKEGALLDACTLDVAVIGSEKAAAVYVGAPAPAAVGQ